MLAWFKKLISWSPFPQKTSDVELSTTSNLGQLDGLPHKDGGYNINDTVSIKLGNDVIKGVPLLTWAIMNDKDGLALDLIKKGANVNECIPLEEQQKPAYINLTGNTGTTYGLAIEAADSVGKTNISQAIVKADTGKQTLTKTYKHAKEVESIYAREVRDDQLPPLRRVLTQLARKVGINVPPPPPQKKQLTDRGFDF